jgi:hypothetical protein
MGWLLFFGIIAVAWYVAAMWGELARKIARLLPIAPGIVFGILIVSGWGRALGAAGDAHRWVGHAFVIVLWLCVPFAIGALLRLYFRSRPVVAIVQLVTLLLVLCIGLLASFTGYLGPSHIDAIAQETHNRFVILHLYFLPALFLVLLIEWWWFFRPTPSKKDV